MGDAGTHERSIPRLMNAVTVALNLVPTSTYTSLTCSSLAFPMLHLRRQSCNCFVVSRRAATVSCTLDPIYIQTVQIRRIRLMKQSVSTNVGAIGPVFRTSSVNRGRSVHVFCHDLRRSFSSPLTAMFGPRSGSRKLYSSLRVEKEWGWRGFRGDGKLRGNRQVRLIVPGMAASAKRFGLCVWAVILNSVCLRAR